MGRPPEHTVVVSAAAPITGDDIVAEEGARQPGRPSPLVEPDETVFARLGWNFPDTLEEKRSMAVFEDLWAQGFCVAGGSNYGADFVVYDGKQRMYTILPLHEMRPGSRGQT